MREREPSAKALVFSQFASTIDWLKVKLQEQGFGYRTISGSMTLKQRSKVCTLPPHTACELFSFQIPFSAMCTLERSACCFAVYLLCASQHASVCKSARFCVHVSMLCTLFSWKAALRTDALYSGLLKPCNLLS